MTAKAEDKLTTSTSSIGTDRVVWIDASKGFAIILMVFGHVLGGAVERGILDAEGASRHIYSFIYLFHMPLFFVMSGLFCIEPMRTSPVSAFIVRTESIAWPYFFWEFLVGTAILSIANAFSASSSDNGWSARLIQALSGELGWFLWTLYVMQIMLIPIARLPVWVLFIASVAACLFLQGTDLGSFSLVVDHLPFLLFGSMMRPFAGRIDASDRWTLLFVSLGGFLFLWLSLTLGWTEHKSVWLLCGVAGTLASICLVEVLGKTIEQTILANLGIATLAIYLLHPYFLKAGVELIARMLDAPPLGQLLVLTIIGVTGPFLVQKVAPRLGLSWVFRLRLRHVTGRSRPLSASPN